MHKAYKGAILYFLLFSIMLLVSSVMLFEHKIGLSVEGISRYYLGDDALFIPKKSFGGVLKIVAPHIFAFGLFSMVLLHFAYFTSRAFKKLIVWFFISIFLELFTPLLLLYGYESFAYLKLLSFLLFESLILYVLWILFVSIVYE